MILDAMDTKPDERRSGKEIVQKVLDNVKAQLQLHPIRVFILALIAGGLLCFGAAVGVRLSTGFETAGAQHFLVTFGFLAGFTVVNLSGALLNSVANVEYSVYVLHNVNSEYHKDALMRIGLFWIIVNIGNLVGCLSTAAMLIYVDIFTIADEERLKEILTDKLRHADDGFRGCCVVFVSAMLANWIVGHCVINANSSRNSVGKFFGIFYCVFMFSVLGLQHGAATNGQVALGLISDVSPISWIRALWGNVLPTIIGNALGALIFVSWPFWYSYYFTKMPENSWKQRVEDNMCIVHRERSEPLA